MADLGDTNALLAFVRQEYQRYRLFVESSSELDDAAQIAADECVSLLHDAAHRLRLLLDEHVTEPNVPVAGVAPDPWAFYEREILPNLEAIDNVYRASLSRALFDDRWPALASMANVASPSGAPAGPPVARAIWIGIQTAYDVWDEHPEWNLEGYDFQRAEDLVRLTFFAPDDWMTNLRDLQPVVTGRTSPFSPQIRIRLKEVYRSFIFGNWLAAFALSRSLLEYCVRERARPLGVDPSDTSGRPKRLEVLLDDVAGRAPQLTDLMELVRHYGNVVMHPSKARDVDYLPLAVRRDALNVINAIRQILSELYRPR